MIYLQSNENRTLPHHFDVACALYGANDLGVKYCLITFDDINSGKFDLLIKHNLFVGSVEFMKCVFGRIGKHNVRLPMNSNRSSQLMSLKDAKKLKNVFIKPYDIKLFTGFVLDGYQYPILDTLPDDTMILVYDPFKYKIISEWRIYVFKNKIEDAHFYAGNVKISPDYDYVELIIKENKNNRFPNTYVIDIGILENGDNVVIEYNDMWAIGNYGVPNDIYVKMLKERYFEIINESHS